VLTGTPNKNLLQEKRKKGEMSKAKKKIPFKQRQANGKSSVYNRYLCDEEQSVSTCSSSQVGQSSTQSRSFHSVNHYTKQESSPAEKKESGNVKG